MEGAQNDWGDLFPDEINQMIAAGVTPDEALLRIRQLDSYSATFPALPSWYEPMAPDPWTVRLVRWMLNRFPRLP